MKYTRLFTKENGDSAFSDEELKLNSISEKILATEMFKTMGFEFIVLEVNSIQDLHTAPRRQWIFHLAGAVEVEVTNGEKRRFHAGDKVLVEDTTGKGHITRVLNDTKAELAILPLI